LMRQTSNLDNESEAIVQDSINQVAETVTTFIVAHRLSTVRNANVIYVMSKGRVIEYDLKKDYQLSGGDACSQICY